MISQIKRRNIGAILALALLLLLSSIGLGVGARPFAGTQAGSSLAPASHAVLAPGSSGPAAAGIAANSAAPSSNAAYPAHSTVIHAEHHDVSPSLRTLAALPQTSKPVRNEQEIRGHGTSRSSGALEKDPVVQRSFGPLAMPTPSLVFQGINNLSGFYPPDTTGDVGPNHYVQWVNLSFQIWDKNGTSLLGPANGNTIWSGFGGQCQQDNAGDPIVQYDQLADRWMISQFAAVNYPSGPFYQCIAVSSTPDPTGSWNNMGTRPAPPCSMTTRTSGCGRMLTT